MFSIFLPVRNGWPYIEQCVKSILYQSDQNFELNVLDNGSTDDTVDWLRSLGDRRLRISFSAADLPIEQSWARIVGHRKRKFMTIIGHDDLLDRDFLAAIGNLISQRPDAGLYQTGARYINQFGNKIRSCRPVSAYETAAEYLWARLKFKRDVFGTGYVMRSSDFNRLGGIPKFEKLFFADDALWLSLMRGSYKVADPRELCSVRIHDASESASMPTVWGSILKGLGEFMAFLNAEAASDADIKRVLAESGQEFLLKYHRNLYVYALIDSCQGGMSAAKSEILIRESLRSFASERAGALRASAKIRLIEVLVKLGMCSQVVWLWNKYLALKTRGMRSHQ